VQAVQSHADTEGILGIGGRELSGCVFFVFFFVRPVFVLCNTNDARVDHKLNIDGSLTKWGSQESSCQEEDACEGVPKA